MNSDQTRPPNLLFLFTDEQRFDTLAACGATHVRMPNVNRLAAGSCLFDQAYCTQPVCTPSRSSLMTGLFPHATGAANNNMPLRADARCLPELLELPRRAQYATGYHGKWHLGDEAFAQHGFDEWCGIEDYFYRDYFSPGRDRSTRSPYAQWLCNSGFKPDLDNTFSRQRCSTLPERYGKAAYVADRSSRFIREHRDRPFILYASFLEPHMPFFGPRTGEYDADTVPLPVDFEIPTAADPLKLRLLAEEYRRNGFQWYDLSTEAGWRQIIAAYYGLCTLVDHHIGRVLETLSACELDGNTIVVFTSDHGEMMGTRRTLGKMLSHRDSVRVPCMIRLPGQRRGQTIRGPFSQIDLVPTLLDLLGQQPADPLHGVSRAAMLGGDDVTLNDDVFIEWNRPRADDDEQWPKVVPDWMTDVAGSPERAVDALTQASRTIVTADGWRCTIDTELGEHELFDLQNDPHERSNLARDPNQADRMRAFRARLVEWQRRVGDTIELPSDVVPAERPAC